MGVNFWGESPLYVNPVNVVNILTKILTEGKGGTARDRPEETREGQKSQKRSPIAGTVCTRLLKGFSTLKIPAFILSINQSI